MKRVLIQANLLLLSLSENYLSYCYKTKSKKMGTLIEQINCIIHDPWYQLCLHEAMQSKSSIERYGSVLVNNEQVIGRGHNRRVSKSDEGVRMGYANHAEVEALNDALRNGYETQGSKLFVAGYFPENGSLHIRDSLNYTCHKCPKYLKESGVIEIHVPLILGWKALSIDKALECAQEFKKNPHKKRLSIGKSQLKLDMIASQLTNPKLLNF